MLAQLPVLPLVNGFSAAALAAAVTLKPIETRRRPGTDRTAGKRPSLLRIQRSSLVGTVAVYAIDCPEIDYNGGPTSTLTPAAGGTATGGTSWSSTADHWANKTQLAAAAATFQTDIPYTAFSAYNWLVRIDREDMVSKSGTVTIVTGSPAVTGSSSAFRKEIVVGANITIGTETKTVVAVLSDTVLLCDTPFTQTGASGLSYTALDTRALQYNASASAAGSRDDYKVTDVGGYALITFGCSNKGTNVLPINTIISVVRTTPRLLVSAAEGVDPGFLNIMAGEFAFVVVTGSTTTGAATTITNVSLEHTAF